MYSLFTKIFLSFWLVAVLLGAAMFTAEHYLGDDALKQAVERVDAHGETVAALLAEEGMPAVRRWLTGMSRSEHVPLFLVDENGRPLNELPMRNRFREHMERNFQPGVHPLRPGLFAVVRPVPGTNPPLHIATLVRIASVHQLPVSWRLAIAIVVSGAVALGLATLITRPVRRLRHAAQALADGDLSVRVPESGRDEVSALARDFNIMTDRVRDLLEAQRRLLRDVSHELRSPLARLRVALELARKTGDTTAVLPRIEREADRLENLVTDVLSLARLEAGQTRLQRQSTEFGELLRAIAQDAEFEAQAAGKTVQLALPDEPPVIEADPVLLRAAIENVVRNAVRHTAPAGAVELSMHRDGKEWIVEVRDHGTGVPEAELETLFQPFTRVGEARDRSSGGYGLGLAISRQAVEAHGGHISARNAAGGGLRVSLRLPTGSSTA